MFNIQQLHKIIYFSRWLKQFFFFEKNHLALRYFISNVCCCSRCETFDFIISFSSSIFKFHLFNTGKLKILWNVHLLMWYETIRKMCPHCTILTSCESSNERTYIEFISLSWTRMRVTSVKIPSLRLKRDVSIKRRCRNFFSLHRTIALLLLAFLLFRFSPLFDICSFHTGISITHRRRECCVVRAVESI